MVKRGAQVLGSAARTHVEPVGIEVLDQRAMGQSAHIPGFGPALQAVNQNEFSLRILCSLSLYQNLYVRLRPVKLARRRIIAEIQVTGPEVA